MKLFEFTIKVRAQVPDNTAVSSVCIHFPYWPDDSIQVQNNEGLVNGSEVIEFYNDGVEELEHE